MSMASRASEGALALEVMRRSAPASGWKLAIAVILTVSAAVYLIGLLRLWRHAGPRRGVNWVNVAAFTAALAALVIALLSPLDSLSAVLFSAHMGQHEI